MSSEDLDKHDGSEDVDFGEGEDFDEPLTEEFHEDATEAKDEPSDTAEANPGASDTAAAEDTQQAAEGGTADDATPVDASAADASSGPAVNDTPDVAVAGQGEEAAPSQSSTAKNMAGGADPLEEPPHGSEVFVGGIPKASTVTDEELLEFAEAGGEVYSCAVLTDPTSGQNRGYGFIKYKSKEIAQAAMAKLNDTHLRAHPSIKIRVLPSQSKNRLYLGNLPKEKSKDELESLLKAATKGLETVELLMSKEFAGQNRGFCFLEFYNHACAQAAKAALSPPQFQLGNKPLTITFAEPRRADTDQSQDIKSIFVGNLPDSATQGKLSELFAPLGEITRAFIPAPRDGKKRSEFGFVHFQDRSSVVQAIANHDKGEKLLMDGTPLEVKMGRVYHETPPQRMQQSAYQQSGYGGRGMANMGMSMGAGRYGGGRGPGFQQLQQQAGRMGSGPAMNMGYGGDYGQYSGALTGMAAGYGGQMMDTGYGGGGGEEYYDNSYGSYGGGMGAMGGVAGMAAAAGAGMAMVPMMLPNGQIGYVLSNAGGSGGGAAAGGMGGGMMGMGMGGPVRGRGAYGAASNGAAAVGGYGNMGRGRGGNGYGGRGSAQQRYTPY